MRGKHASEGHRQIITHRDFLFILTGVLAETLARPDVECVILATPTQMHASQAIACMKAGKHVLLEKPPGATVAGMYYLRSHAVVTAASVAGAPPAEYTVTSLATWMRGSMDVESTPGQGTRVEFLFPLSSPGKMSR